MIGLDAAQLHELAEELSRLQHTTAARSAQVSIGEDIVYVAYDEGGDMVAFVAADGREVGQAGLISAVFARGAVV